MRYKLFGKSGLRVSELCLGVMGFGGESGYGSGIEENKKIFDTYVNAGGNFLDTADHYNEGRSEIILSEFIHQERERFVVASKFSLYTPPFEVMGYFGNHRKHMIEAVNASLKRLNTDYIDILWLHAWDYTTPIEEVMRSLDDLVRAGKVNYVGASNTPAWIVSRGNMLAELRGWSPFIGVQVEYSAVSRSVELEFLYMAKQLDLAVACWQPFAGGALTLDEEEIEIRMKNWGMKPLGESQQKAVQAVASIAKEVGRSPAQVALNWLRQKDGVVIPIFGARIAEHVKDNLKCLEWALTNEQMAKIDDANPPESFYPYNQMQFIFSLVYGGMGDVIDNHRGWHSSLGL